MKKQLVSITAISVGLLAGCGSGSDSDVSVLPGSEKPYVTVTVDASSTSEWRYFDIAHGEQVSAADDWHVALRRYDIRLNEQVQGAIGDEQADYYDNGSPLVEAFVNATAALEEQSLYDVTDASGLTFESSGAKPYIDNSWYSYNFVSHALTANSDNYWVLRSSSADSYALMHATDIDAGYNASFAFYVQADGEDSFSDTPVTVTIAMTTPGKTCYDFDAGSNVDCSSDGWDVMFDMASRSYRIWLNGGAGPDGDNSGNAAAYGVVAADDYSAGSELISHAWSQDSQASVFSSYSWYEYGVNGGHYIWPNFRVYVIDRDKNSDADALLKLQVIGYYNDSGTSGHVTLRYMDLADNGN